MKPSNGKNLNWNFRKPSSTRNSQEFRERFVLGERCSCNSAPFLFILQPSTSPQTRHLVFCLPYALTWSSLLQQQLRCLPPQLPFSLTARQTAHYVLTQAWGVGGGGGGQKAAWNLMTSKGLFAAQVQPPPNFCPLLVPPALIGLIEDKLFEMDAQ